MTGAADLDIDLHAGEVRVGDARCTRVTGSRSTGPRGRSPLTTCRSWRPAIDARFETVLRWCDELRELGVRANADTPADAVRAHRFGAAGIGLCRTEHMFMAPDRQPKMRAMIMADDEARSPRRARGAAAAPAGRLRGPVRGDGGPAGDDPAARPAAARVPSDRFELHEEIVRAQVAGARAAALEHAARADALTGGDQPDARHARRAARAAPPRDLRDAGARDRPRRARGPRAHRRRAEARDHDPAGRLRARARARARSCDRGRCRGGVVLRRGLHASGR